MNTERFTNNALIYKRYNPENKNKKKREEEKKGIIIIHKRKVLCTTKIKAFYLCCLFSHSLNASP